MTTKAPSMSRMRTTLLSCSSMIAMKRLLISKEVTLGKLLLQHRLIVLSASLGPHLMKTSSYIRLFSAPFVRLGKKLRLCMLLLLVL
ncbi:hypothetical protein Hdeb2414_s0026g00673601 [Helianthus debilis subsp. tardiflorus]